MAEIWMFTCPRLWKDVQVLDMDGEVLDVIDQRITMRMIQEVFKANDAHKWTVGIEKGADGYEHYQGRFVSSRDNTFEWCKNHIPPMHLEKADKWSDYECKEGRFIASDDFTEQRKVRFGTPRPEQQAFLKELQRQSVREIDVWYDPKGNHGKSWLCNWLYETRQAWYIAPTLKSPQAIIQDVASKMMKDKRPIVVIDIPRSWQWSEALYTAIETIKDGLVDDPRYDASTTNIRGVKVLVLTNTRAELDALSQDRWVINGKYPDKSTRAERAWRDREERRYKNLQREWQRIRDGEIERSRAGEDPRTPRAPARCNTEDRGVPRGGRYSFS